MQSVWGSRPGSPNNPTNNEDEGFTTVIRRTGRKNTSNMQENATFADMASKPPQNNTIPINGKTPAHNQRPTPNPTQTTPSKYVPRKENAIVIDNTQEYSQEKCVRAVADIIGGNKIHYCNRLSGGRLCLYLTDQTTVDKMCQESGIIINDVFLPCRRYVSHATKVVISNCPPELPDEKLKELLQPYGKLTSSPSRMKLSTNDEDLKHILTWRVVVYMLFPHDAEPMPKMIPIVSSEGIKTTLYVDKNDEFCTYCNVSGHSLSKCKKKVNDNNNFPEFISSVNSRLTARPTVPEPQNNTRELEKASVQVPPEACPLTTPSTSNKENVGTPNSEPPSAFSSHQVSGKNNQERRILEERRVSQEIKKTPPSLPTQENNFKPLSVQDDASVFTDWTDFENSQEISNALLGKTSSKRIHSPDDTSSKSRRTSQSESEDFNMSDSGSTTSSSSHSSTQSTKSKEEDQVILNSIVDRLKFDSSQLTKAQLMLFLKFARGKSNSKKIADRVHCNVPALIGKLKEISVQSTNFNLSRRIQRAIQALSETDAEGLHQNRPMARLDRIYTQNKDLNIISKIAIVPSFSDHSAVTTQLNLKTGRFKPPYWKFDTTLLKSQEYNQIITNITDYFHTLSREVDCDILNLWDDLKAEIKIASQRFMKKLFEENQQQLSILTAQIKHISALEELTEENEKALLYIEKEIAKLFQSKSEERMKLLKIDICNEANIQSKFFLRLARQAKPSAIINQLQINGEVTSNKHEILSHIRQKFMSTFEGPSPPLDPDSPIFKELPKLEDEQRQICEEEITEEEVKDSMNKAQLNRAPGLDGLPLELYKFFWNQIGPIFMKVIQNFQKTGKLPNSMKKIVVSPIPKKGDRTLLKNWRAISLINVDYKIISRIYGTRMSSVISTLLTSDQSYCVPGRTIYDNLHLLRNVIRHSNISNSQLAILSLDQTEAFNNVSHQYFNHLLTNHGFGPKFCKAITSLLTNSKGFIKIGSSLVAPFTFKKGFRQGDPIAGPLYILSIEPFLRYANNFSKLEGYKIPNSPSVSAKSTAFADDINFFITEDEDFKKINEAYDIFSQQSGGKLNEEKSSLLLCGKWKSRSNYPIQCIINNEGDKFLGVQLGNNPKWEQKNWDDLLIKIKGLLSKWSQYVKLTSYQGRRIICNQLVGSLLIHVLTILQPPQKFILEAQKEINNFLWQGKHWLHPNHLYSKQETGGQNLINIQAKIKLLRLNLANRIQQDLRKSNPSNLFHRYNLSLYGNISPYLFFCHRRQNDFLVGLDCFYQSLAIAWHDLNVSPIFSSLPLQLLRQIPLQGSLLINEEKLRVLKDWEQVGVHTLKSLLNEDGTWNTLEFQNQTSTQQRRLAYNYNQIKVYINKLKKNVEEDEDFFQDIRFQFQPATQKNPVIFPSNKKTLYQTILAQVLTKNPILSQSTILHKKVIFTSFYCFPTEKKDSDISWRLVHNCLITPKKLYDWNIIERSSCPWCPQEIGDILHMMFNCRTTKSLWNSASQKINKINNTNEKLSLERALCGFQPSSPSTRISNFILNLAKSTIYQTYSRLIKEDYPNEPNYKKIFEARIKFRFCLEEIKANIYNTREEFKKTFMINNFLE
ncbi:hypothetical protein ONE63_007167 [Megalurothrips usitatus]|uniref:Reverse transcriptase domain-containing protein n=1 Tax=Megalurothrips usitatus TaxID=439358 RepID=A0AAV7XXL6_9NEOP|nr:hypothetical protein ONE63_007167 [Megalurothrips usitatus]